MPLGRALCSCATAKSFCYPEGCAAPGDVRCQCNTRGLLSKLEKIPPQRKIHVTSKSPVGDISDVTLIRTDTTLDHSQKAEKVCDTQACSGLSAPIKTSRACLRVTMARILPRTGSSMHRSAEGAALRCKSCFAFLRCWQWLASQLPKEKYCYG